MGLGRLHFYRRRARRWDSLPAAVEEARALLGVHATFFVSSEIETPVTCGAIRPAVLFPARFPEMPAEHQRAVACHELLHVRRHDWTFHLAEEVIRALPWFHPAIWWLTSRIRLAREQVVDSEVLRLLKSRRPYLEALLEIAAGPAPLKAVPAPLFLAEHQLPQRIAAMLKEVSMSRPRLLASLTTMASALLFLGGLSAWSFPLHAPWNPQEAAPQKNAPPAAGARTPAEKPLKVGKDVTRPVPLYKPEPKYTPEARAAKLQGVVVLTITIDASGNVTDVQVEKSMQPSLGLDQSAVKTVRTWKFKPATKKGKPVAVKSQVEINFKLY